MAYESELRRMGDAIDTAGVLYAIPTAGGSLVVPAVRAVTPSSFDLLGALSSGVTNTEDFLYNAATGNLTQNQIKTIQAQTNAGIAQAASGNKPLADAQSAAAAQDLANVIKSGYYGGPANVLADLGVDPNAPAGLGSTGILGWIENNKLLVFALVAAFVVFRPDKAFKRR